MARKTKKYWVMKSEPSVFSLDDLKNAPGATTCWEGVRNYQARNFMRDEMQVGDQVLFYHSSCKKVGVVGIAEVVKEAYPDSSAHDPNSSYFDPKSSPDNPRWYMVDIKHKQDLPRLVSLKEIKANDKLSEMLLVQKGQRLSIQPVKKKEFDTICRMAKQPPQ